MTRTRAQQTAPQREDSCVSDLDEEKGDPQGVVVLWTRITVVVFC
jgi:hypothetical protein